MTTEEFFEKYAPKGAPPVEVDDGETVIGTLWQHIETGGVYTIFALCQIEATGEHGVLYHSVEGRRPLWCRPMKEFMDGRFAPASIRRAE